MLAAAFALTLAGCGGNGGGGTAAMPDPDTPVVTPEPDPQETCEAGGGRYEADGMCTSAEERITEAAQMACEGAGGRYETDGMCTSASAVAQQTCEGDGGRYEMNGSCTSSEDVATETCVAGGGRSNADGSCTSAGDLATTTSAGTKMTAIATEAGTDAADDAGLGGSGVDTVMMTISRPSSGTEVKIADSAMAGEDDPKFTLKADLGGGITRHDRTQDADDDGDVVNEIVMVSTDIDAPKATAFAKVAGQGLDVTTNTDNDDPADTFEALAVDQSDEDVRALVKSDAFKAGTAAVLTFARFQADSDNNMDGAQKVDAFETAGTYNGADGTYKCNAGNNDNDCTVSLDAKGAITEMSDGWIFTPDDGATSDVADANYLTYGFWLMTTTDEDGLTYNEVQTFATSSVAASGSVSDVTGSATYEGDALGVYVKNVHKTDGTIDTATSGHFTADVNLTATFDQVPVSDTDDRGTIAPSLLNTLSGTIDNFELAGGEANAWSVNLQGMIDTGAGTAAGSANGGGAAGTYSATFHGPTADDTQPHSVVGEFGANFSNGTVAGAFGARK